EWTRVRVNAVDLGGLPGWLLHRVRIPLKDPPQWIADGRLVHHLANSGLIGRQHRTARCAVGVKANCRCLRGPVLLKPDGERDCCQRADECSTRDVRNNLFSFTAWDLLSLEFAAWF